MLKANDGLLGQNFQPNMFSRSQLVYLGISLITDSCASYIGRLGYLGSEHRYLGSKEERVMIPFESAKIRDFEIILQILESQTALST